MSVAPAPTITLSRRFAGELGEMTLSSRAAAAPAPHLLVLNEPLAVELGVDPDWLRSPDGLNLLLGTAVPGDATPVAQAYAGHQFGYYSPAAG